MFTVPAYTDDIYWTDLIEQYIKDANKYVSWFNVEDHMWAYFKQCLRHMNRFFFKHPLMPLLESEFSKHTCVLAQGQPVFRARVDRGNKLWNEWLQYQRIDSWPGELKLLQTHKVSEQDIANCKSQHEEFVASSEIQQIKARIDSGFQGFDASGSSAPPSEYASAGRCNPQGVSYLYAALEEHTAIAEIRPFIKDAISIALLKPKRDLRLVNFDFEPEAVVSGENFLFNSIQRDFARINKSKDGEYLITQFITALIEHLGYDGLCFKSSLVKDGTNYVIFDPEICPPISSELCILPEVTYKFIKCNDFGKKKND